MAWFRKTDPISVRARALNSEIAALEAEIQKLDSQLQQNRPSQENPRLRSTALPHGAMPHRVPEHIPPVSLSTTAPGRPRTEREWRGWPPGRIDAQEPIFEDVGHNRLKARGENETAQALYNELGVRKYDLPALLQRMRNHFRGPSATNPKLVNYLAAGGIQGLRPMRYEKRVARNRFLALVVFLFVVMLGIILAFLKHR